MHVSLILLNLLVVPLFGFKNPKICVECQYFVPNPNRYFNSDKFGKCLFFPKKIETNVYTLVSGVQESEVKEYTHCSIARNSDQMCGPEGKRYRKKYQPKS